MPYHVRICKITDNRIIFAALNCLAKLIANLFGTHLRLEVVGRYLLCRRHQYTVFMLIGLLSSSVKEKGDMSIFLCLRYAKLPLTLCRYIFAEGIMYLFLYKDYSLMLYGLIIIGKAGVAQIHAPASVEETKLIIAEGTA